jgi:hypothetical protein
MLVAPRVTYPGVYIQEVPSDVRTIIGVDTATTAFVGRAKRGPVNKPVVVNSYADFERIFGGLWLQSTLGYAVSDFFLNGGSKAVIVRLFKNSAPPGPPGAPEPPTAGSVAQAARTKADEFVGGSNPVRTAANNVAEAAEAAASAAGATPETVVAAAKSKADDIQASSPSNPAKESARAVADAASGAAAAPSPIAATAPSDKASLAIGADDSAITLEALSAGAWGNQLHATVSDIDPKVADQMAARYGVERAQLFTLIISDDESGAREEYPNVTVVEGPRRIDRVLANASALMSVSGNLPAQRPAATTAEVTASGGSDGQPLTSAEVTGQESNKTGIYALEDANIFNLLCIPPFDGSDVSTAADVAGDLWAKAAAYCLKRRAMLLIDPPQDWDKDGARDGVPLSGIGAHTNAALYFPRIKEPNPLRDKRIESFVPCGAVAGIMARTDAVRGVWKAPAGLEATLNGVFDLTVPLTNEENGELNPLGINCLRKLPAAGNVVWGARTLVGDDRLASQWKYIPVRRTALFIEESIYRNIQWAVFEPNDEPLWAQLRLNIGVFMHGLFRQGAFQGQSPKDAYFVKCDATTTTQADIDKGIVNVVVGFAPLKPAEFVVIYIQQIAGQLAA